MPGAITLFESLDPEATRPAWLLLRLGDFLVAHGRTLEAQSLYTEGLDRVDGSSPGLRSNPEPETRPVTA